MSKFLNTENNIVHRIPGQDKIVVSDFEKGVWNATLNSSANLGVGGIVFNKGNWTRTGNLVVARMQIVNFTITTVGTSATFLDIVPSGLPNLTNNEVYSGSASVVNTTISGLVGVGVVESSSGANINIFIGIQPNTPGFASGNQIQLQHFTVNYHIGTLP